MGLEDGNRWVLAWDHGDNGLFTFELVIFLVRVLFPFLHYATVECIGDNVTLTIGNAGQNVQCASPIE
jgi:hypothetical protein